LLPDELSFRQERASLSKDQCRARADRLRSIRIDIGQAALTVGVYKAPAAQASRRLCMSRLASKDEDLSCRQWETGFATH